MTTRQHGHQSVWQRAETIFAQCVELTPEQQNELLAVSCKNQAELRTIVEDLLRLHTQTLSIDEPPSLSVVADSMDQQSIQSWVGRRVGNYQIQKAIGQGGMGHVYLAERIDDTFNKQVAIKFVGRSRQMAHFIEQFIAERQFLASMNHPYIATLLDGGTLDDGTPYLVMEYIQGIPITAYCDQHDLSLKERLLLFIKVLQAVDYAHRQLVIHQDIKPDNILVQENGLPKLLDFGIASLSGRHDDEANGSNRHLSPNYASTEQIRGERIGIASDIYSLGVLLYQLLTGKTPYHLSSLSVSEILQELEQQPLIKPSERLRQLKLSNERRHGVSRLNSDLDAIVMKALAVDAADRYQFPQLMQDDLQNYLTKHPVSAVEANRWYWLSKFISRHKTIVISSFLIALALMFVTGQSVVQSQRLKRERDRAFEHQSYAEQITAYLVSAFTEADPRSNNKKEKTAGEILDESIARLDEVKLESEVDIRLRETLARASFGLGDYLTARDLLETALTRMQIESPGQGALLDQRSQLEGRTDTELELIARISAQIAEIRIGLGDNKTAQYDIQRAIMIYEQLGKQPDLIPLLSIRAMASYNLGQRSHAQTDYEHALSLSKVHHGENSFQQLKLLAGLASIVGAEQGDEAAIPLQLDVVRVYEHHQMVDEHYGASLHRLAKMYRSTDQLEQAFEVAQKAKAVYEQVFGNQHIKIAYTLNTLGGIEQQRKNLSQAEEHYIQSLALKEQNFSTKIHPTISTGANNLATLYADQGEHEKAIEWFRLATTVGAEFWDNNHVNAITMNVNFGQSLAKTGQYQEARAVFLSSLEGADHSESYHTQSDHKVLLNTELAALGLRDKDIAVVDFYLQSARELLNSQAEFEEKTKLRFQQVEQQLDDQKNQREAY